MPKGERPVILKRTGIIQSGRSDAEAGTARSGRGAGAIASLPPGTVLQDRFEILGILGRGGMSTVYRGRDRRFAGVDRIVAIKEMFDISQDASARRLRLATFEREASLLATLHHPGIPKIHDYFTLNGRIYLILEFIEGDNLETMLDSRHAPIPEPELVGWATQVCELLTYLHNHSPDPIIFRDIKPSNIMLHTASQRVILVDFGIARSFQGERRGTMIGTEGYAPPEQYRGLATPAGDIYALGATLHHLGTASDPRAETPFTFHQRPPRQLNPALSEALEAVILKACSYNAADRYSSAEAMRQAILDSQVRTTLPPPLIILPEAERPAAPKRPLKRPAAQPAPLPTGMLTPAEGDAANRLCWTVRTNDEVRSSPTVAGDHAYIGSYDSHLYAVSLAEGTVTWRAASGRGICSSPAVDGDLVIFGSEDNAIYAVERATGRRAWMYRTGLPVRSSARIADGCVYIGSDDGYLYCLELRSGALAWRTRTWSHVRSSCAIYGDSVAVGSDDGYLYSLDRTTGSILWRFQTTGAIISSPLVVDDLIFLGSMDGHVYAVRAATGERVWRVATGQPVIASVAHQDGTVYASSTSGFVYALNVEDGAIQWHYEDPSQVTSTAAVDEDYVYYGSGDGHVRCLDRADGRLVWQYKTGGPIPSSPALADSLLLVGSTDHRLYALDVDEAMADTE